MRRSPSRQIGFILRPPAPALPLRFASETVVSRPGHNTRSTLNPRGVYGGGVRGGERQPALHTISPGAMTVQRLERFLAILGTAICLIVTILIWRSVSAQQPMWPLPGLYFIEMAALSVVSAIAFLLGGRRRELIAWSAAGIFTSFSILGALSVGFFYLPVAVIFGLLAVLSDVRQKQPSAAHPASALSPGWHRRS